MTKTKRVRIAVAVGLDGGVVTVHLPDGQSPAEAFDENHCCLDQTDRITIVEADCEEPEPTATVRGEVVDA